MFFCVFVSGSESKEEDDQLRLYAVDSYLTVLKGHTSHLPQCFLQVMSWVCTTCIYTHTQHSFDDSQKRSALRLIEILV